MNRLFGSGTGKCNNTVSNQNNGEDDKNTDQNNHAFLGLNGMFSSGETFICTILKHFVQTYYLDPLSINNENHYQLLS